MSAAAVEDATNPPPSRILRYDEYFDLRTFAKTLRKTAKSAHSKKLNSKKPVLVVRRLINEKGRHNGTEIDVKSAALCQVLLEINSDVEGLSMTFHNPVIQTKEMFNCRPRLLQRLEEEKARSEPDAALISDISTALQFIEEDYADTIGDFNMLTHHEISYDLLWVIFPPNTLVYRWHTYTEQHQVLLARSFDYRQREDGSYYVLVACDVVSNDGNSFGLARDNIEIDAFRGARRIQNLVVYPLEYHPEQEDIRTRAIARGKRFTQLPKHSYHEMSGPGMTETMNQQWETRRFKFSTHGRVMIDPVAFRLFEPNITFNFHVHRTIERDSLSDEHYIICTPVVLGFSFGVKRWGGFAMDRLGDIEWSDEAFQSLVLGPKQKTLVHSLFKSHKSHSAAFDDIVRGKGKGLIGLFSGSPGCGKTLTAEAVAEATRRPLYSVSAGELGTQPKELDERLSMVLEIAQTWDAVLLLDEAEVFLQQRAKGDVSRNALVSIFLRQLEYYQGILILTTNLIEQCDPAFESRIHFSIHYPDLGFESRRQIWQTFLKKVMGARPQLTVDQLDRLAERSLNGRQIKNTVSSAQCIALDADADLSIEHIDAVLEVIEDWNVARDGAFNGT
ncbi:AAA family [Mycena kentingensis (nom. inval.)]|nr:AAA family [Mycena kentingensis (nom. inval.)]